MWVFFNNVFESFKNSNSKGKIVFSILFIILIIVGIVCGGAYMFYKYNINHMEISKRINDTINPPTDKAENLKEISHRLTEIATSIQALRSEVDGIISANNATISCGINDGELEQWEISIAGKNTLGLHEGDDVLLINSSSIHIQSAKFHVKFVRIESENKKTEIYMNEDSAHFLGIDNPIKRGIFDLKVQRIR